jgi:hypothetical protein
MEYAALRSDICSLPVSRGARCFCQDSHSSAWIFGVPVHSFASQPSVTSLTQCRCEFSFSLRKVLKIKEFIEFACTLLYSRLIGTLHTDVYTSIGFVCFIKIVQNVLVQWCRTVLSGGVHFITPMWLSFLKVQILLSCCVSCLIDSSSCTSTFLLNQFSLGFKIKFWTPQP